MKKSRYKKFFAITFITLLTLATMLFTSSITQGFIVKTYPYLVVTPNPVGVGQSVFIVMWLHGPPPTACGIGGHRYNFTLEVKQPTENEFEFIYPPDSSDPFFISDETGATFAQYTPESVGEYEFKLTYVGQIISRYNPETGIPGYPEPWANIPNLVGSEFLPSEKIEKLTVQEQPLPDPITSYPLPEEYWARPIEGQNTNWWTISSNWLAGAHIQNRFQPDGTAPSSPHIMWTKPIEFGGVVGGTTEIPGIDFYSGGSYEGRFVNAISMFGKLYYQVPLHHSGGSTSSASGYACVDLRTGETIWISDEIGIPYKGNYGMDAATIKGQLYDYETVNQHGVTGGLIWTVYGSTWMAYDAYTGQWVHNFTNVPEGTEVYTKSGEIERYVLNYTARSLSLWTSAATPDSPLVAAPGTTPNAYMYRPMGKNANMSENIKWSVTIPDLPGSYTPTIIKVLPDDLILGTSTYMGLGSITRIPPPYTTMWAISLEAETRGNLLWLQNIPSTPDPAPPNYLTRILGPVDPINRIFTMSDIQTFTWWGYDLDTGAYKWGPDDDPIGGDPIGHDDDYLSDYQYYSSNFGGGQQGFVAYDRLYTAGYGGEIHCFDIQNGRLIWEYSTNEKKDLHPEDLLCETNSVWGYFPIFIAGIADNKIYVLNNEHSPNNPYYKGEKVRCLDAFTGDEIWTLMGMAGQSLAGSTAIIADGFLVYHNYYDNQIYCLGKGPTKTTVTCTNAVPKTAGANQQKVLIQGSVIDLAPGTMQDEQVKRFPLGVPAVSDDSMGPWMEYLYMQKPYPEEVTGVEVNLAAIDPDDNYYQIGTVTSEPSGIYGFDFTPPVPGLYKIIATYQGSDSYWPSVAETFLLVEGKMSKSQNIDSNLEFGGSLLVIGLLAVSTLVGVQLAYRKYHHRSK